MTSSQAQISVVGIVGRYKPVLSERCLDLFAPAIEGAAGSVAVPGPVQPVMIDCTLDMGGHTEAALERFVTLEAVSIGRDPEAIALASTHLAHLRNRFVAAQATYDAISRVAREYSIRAEGAVNTVLMDLGVSPLQFDEASQGFSYTYPVPLGMRMDQGSEMTVQNLLEHADAAKFTCVLHTYGKECFASRIAAVVVCRRESGDPVANTQNLTELVRQSVPASARRNGGHPAKRVSQALCIAVNIELDVLEWAVSRALNSLRMGGRLVVEPYQSSEDHIAKRALAHGATSRTSQDFPVVPEVDHPYLELLTSNAEKADARKLDHNPRSAPVRLQAVARLYPANQAPPPKISVPVDGRGWNPGRRNGRYTTRRHHRNQAVQPLRAPADRPRRLTISLYRRPPTPV